MTAIKESSDELNPTVAVPAAAVAPRKRHSFGDYVALAIATCGVGFFPLAPGTLGSLLGVALYLPLQSEIPRYVMRQGFFAVPVETPWVALRLAVILIIALLGIWAASRTERVMQVKDPGVVVIDEVAGQMIALLSVPRIFPGWIPIISGFVLFRLFDIWKPYPIRKLESLESGLGIMADDVMAGIYAAIVNAVLITGLLALLA